MNEPTDILLSERIAAHVTEELRTAVERAAAAQDLTMADFVRASISDRLDRIGVPHQKLPPLRRRPG
jgi:uncharacterized protein (DUF1778 family)